MAITRRCRDSFITARVCEFVISILKRQEGTSHGVSFSISCTQTGWSQLSAEHQWPDAALALEPPARNPPTRQRHVWLLPPLCRFRRHPRLPGGAAPAAYQVILQCQSKQKKRFIFSTHKHFPSLESGPTNCKTLAWYSYGTVTKWWSPIISIPLVTPSWFNSVGLLILSVDPVCLGRLKPRGSTATPQPRAKTRSSRLWRAWCLAALMSSKFPQMWVNPLCLHAKAFRSVTFKPRHQTFSILLLVFKIE